LNTYFYLSLQFSQKVFYVVQLKPYLLWLNQI